MREIPEAPWHCSRRHPPLSLYRMRTRLLITDRRLLLRYACWVWYGPLLLLLLLLLLLVHLACALLLLLLTCAPLLRCTSRCHACHPSPRSIRRAASRCCTQLLRLLCVLCLLRAAGRASRLLGRLLLPQLLLVARVVCALEPKVFVLLLAVASQLLLCDACSNRGPSGAAFAWQLQMLCSTGQRNKTSCCTSRASLALQRPAVCFCNPCCCKKAHLGSGGMPPVCPTLSARQS